MSISLNTKMPVMKLHAIIYSCIVANACVIHAFAPKTFPCSTLPALPTMRQKVSLGAIGLGPGKEEEKEKKSDVLYSPEGIVDVELMDEPDHELYRTDRMTAFDKKCDEWFGSLVSGEGSLLGKVSEDALKRITTPVELNKKFIIPQNSDNFDPYQMGQLPGSIVYPAYGLETYGLPTPRRKAEAWKTFDVKGLIDQDYSETQAGVGTDLVLDDDVSGRFEDHLKEKAVWVDDDDCSGRLVYVNGRFVPSLSKTTDIAQNLGPDYFSSDDVDEEIIEKLKRLPDGFTDRLAVDVPSGAYFPGGEGKILNSYKNLSEPHHQLGEPETQYAINTQQGTACFVALNSVKAGAVSYINIPPSTIVPKPVVVIHAVSADGGVGKIEDNKGVSSHPRSLVTAGDGAAISFVQAYVDLDEMNAESSVPKLVNGCTQIYVGASANVTHSYLEESGGIPTGGVEAGVSYKEKGTEPPNVIESKRKELRNTHFETVDAHVLGENGRYEGTAVSVGGNGRCRIAFSASLLGEGSHGTINGFSLAGGAQRADFRTFIHHVAEGTTSAQIQKNMIGGKATVSFRGRIRVEQNAQQTTSDQMTRNILLSDKAKVWNTPSLEIIADNVECTHGATISDLSEEELYYLRSRGITKEASRNLLMYAFADDVTNEIVDIMQGDTSAPNSLKKRVIQRLQNLVPRGDRAYKGEYQSS